jgi:hypothetical protein
MGAHKPGSWPRAATPPTASTEERQRVPRLLVKEVLIGPERILIFWEHGHQKEPLPTPQRLISARAAQQGRADRMMED